MAQVLSITNAAGGTEYNFLTGALKPRLNTWRIRPGRGETYIETMELVGHTTDTGIMAATQSITEVAEKARLYHLDLEKDSIFFAQNTTDETAKRALVYDMTLAPIPRGKYTPLLGETGAFYRLAITRGEMEDTAETAVFSTETLNSLGGQKAITATAGSLPGRINQLIVFGVAGGGTLDRIWGGIRPTGEGATSFVSLWELEGGTIWAGDGSVATDTGASPVSDTGNKVVTDFSSDTSMVERVGITVAQAAGDTSYSHFQGKYLVLLRCQKSTDTDVIRVRMKTGYDSGNYFTPGAIKKIPSDSWRFVELGQVSIPPFVYKSQTGLHGNSTLGQFEIQIHAEILGGSGNAEFDCLVLIPAEHSFFSKGNAIVNAGDRTHHTRAADGTYVVAGLDSNSDPNANVEYVFRDWMLPIEGGSFVFAAEGTTAQVVGDQGSVSMTAFLRHRVHRE